MLRKRWVAWLLGLLMAGTVAAGEAQAPAATTMRLALTMSNPTSGPISNAELQVYAPVAAPGHHRLTTIDSSLTYSVSVDALGNRALVFRNLDFPPYSAKRLVLSFAMQASGNDASAPLPAHLQPEPFVESDAGEVVAIARRLAGDGPPDGYPRRVHEWLRANMRYAGYIAEDRGARYAAQTLSGDCTEYAALFVALMRAQGVPARLMGGWVFRGSALVRAADYHNWAEFYSGGRWRLADPQKGAFDEREGEYVATRIVAHVPGEASFAHRFRVNRDELQVTMD